MSVVITVLYDVNTTVYYVNADTGVRKGVVQSFDASKILNIVGEVTEYTVQFTHAQFGSVVTTEDTLFPDVDTALAAYKVMVQAQ